MISNLKFHCVALLLVLLPSLLLAEDSSKKNPVPDPVALKNALGLVNDIFKNDLAGANTPAQKAKVVKKMLDAAEGEKDMASRFAILTKARELSIDYGDFTSALAAVDAMDKVFNIDVLKMKADVAVLVAKSASAINDRKALAQQISDIIAAAVVADRYEIGRTLAEAGLRVARSTNDAELMRKATADVQQVRDAEGAYAEVKTFIIVLADKPNDPEANQKIGKFRCFIKEDWEKGLPMLVLGNDPTMKSLAEMEIAGVNEPDEQVKLGDGWWNAGEKEKNAIKYAMRKCAAKSYVKALPLLSGLLKTRVENRLAEMKNTTPSAIDISPSMAAPITLTGVQKESVLTLPATKVPHRLRGEYKVPVGQELVIDAGATIICEPNSQITISGTIRITGDVKKPVTFRGTKSLPGSWKGIMFQAVEKADIQYLWVSDAENGVQLVKSNGTFTGCIFAGNENGGAYESGSNPSLSDCVISLNTKNGLVLTGGSSPTIDSCTITRNGG
ncbi:MAG: right-handed parallel beta-helix repeat-containing protein, partial [Phycisphaerae bacterium]